MRPHRRRPSSQANPDHEAFQDLLSGIEIPHPFDIEKFCDAVSKHRGRPLVTQAMEGLLEDVSELCGLWIELDHADYVFYESATSPLHQQHIILHEISHILLGHTAADDPGTSEFGPFAGIDPATVRNVLGRANFSAPQEREAEQLASQIAEKAILKSPPQTETSELARINAALRNE